MSPGAGYFLNSAMGWGALPAANLPGGGPAYPLASLGVRGQLKISDAVTALAGVYSGSPLPAGSDGSQLSNPSGVSSASGPTSHSETYAGSRWTSAGAAASPSPAPSRLHKLLASRAQKPLRSRAIRPNIPLAQYARACGRVPVGGDLDKRPVNRRLKRPAAGGEPANPAQRGTRLEATTDRAFLVSAGPPKAGAQRGLSILPGVRTGHFLVQTMASIAWGFSCPERILATAQQLTASRGPSTAPRKPEADSQEAVASAGQRLRIPRLQRAGRRAASPANPSCF